MPAAATVTDRRGLEAAVDAVRERVASAAARAGRHPEEITIVAVAKTFPAPVIAAAVACGLADIGENRVQELLGKQEALGALPIRWHFVGTLQRNKAGRVAGRVALIHSIDSVALARAVGEHARAAATEQDVLLQVNVAGEPAKHGTALAKAREVAGEVAAVPGVRLRGFMTIPPAADPAGARAAYTRLRSLRDGVARVVPSATELSMGMSADMEIGIEEGATLVRVGTAVFGVRRV